MTTPPPEESYFCIAGVNIQFTSAFLCPFPFPPGYEPFRLHRAPDHIDAHFTFLPEEGHPVPVIDTNRPVIWNSSHWTLHHTTRQELLMQVRKIPEPEFQMAGILHADFSGGTLFPRRTTGDKLRTAPFCFPTDEQILLNLLARHHRGLIHGCSIADGSRSLLFCGKSGAGKSTVAKLWRDAGCRILNDDRTLLHIEDNCALGSASPWHGELHDITPDTFPLAGIFRLKHAKETSIRRLSSTEGFQTLLANAIAPFYLPDSLDPVTGVLADVAGRVPAYELSFAPTPDVLSTIRKEIV